MAYLGSNVIFGGQKMSFIQTSGEINISISITSSNAFTVDWGNELTEVIPAETQVPITHIWSNTAINHEVKIYNTDFKNIRFVSCVGQNVTDIELPQNMPIIQTIQIQNNNLTSFKTYKEWASLETLYVYTNSLTSLETHAEWVSIRDFQPFSNSLTSLETHKEWVNLQQFSCMINPLTSLETHAEWVSIKSIFCFSTGINNLNVFIEWVLFNTLLCQNNAITDATNINKILSTVDSIGTINGNINLSGGSSVSPNTFSGGLDGIQAKNNLISKNFTVTTN